MTVQQPRARRRAAPTEHTSRLLLKPEARKTGYVDGAWWPHDTDLTAELPSLLESLSDRVGPIRRVVYRPDQWSKAPAELVTVERAVQLDGYRSQPCDTLEVLGVAGRRLVLLVVPPHTTTRRACRTMMRAARPDNAWTVSALRAIASANRTETAAAEQRWDSEAGALIEA